MKTYLFLLCIIVPLILFFVIIDRKEFYNCDNTSFTSKVEPKRDRVKNTYKTDRQTDRQTDDIDLSEDNSFYHSESRSNHNSSEKENSLFVDVDSLKQYPARNTAFSEPAAVPAVSPDEAEKINEFSYFLSKAKTTVVEGEILERSVLPDPKMSDYPNCRFTVHFQGNSIKSGEPCPKELSLIIEGFMNYTVLSNNDIETGDKVVCTIIPFDQLPEDFQSTQQADDLELFLLESYYVANIHTIKRFTDDESMPISGIFFSDEKEDYISIFDRHINPPIPYSLKNEQAVSIQKDLDKMNRLLEGFDDNKIKEINKLFSEAWEKEKKKDPPNYNRVGKYVWRNIDNSFWTLPEETNRILSKPEVLSSQMLLCFKSLKRALEDNGVQLIVSLVPEMNTIATRVINKDFRDLPDTQTATYVKQLSEIGVETLYTSDEIIKDYNRYSFAFFCPTNPHPSDTSQDIISDILSERLKRYSISPGLDSNLFSVVQCPHVYREEGDYLFPYNCDIGDNQAGKSYTCRDVLYNGEKYKKSKESSIMIVGNSYIETPISTPESLPPLLSYKIKAPVDWQMIKGHGPFSDMLCQLLSNPARFLKGKKVFIYQVGTKHITEINRAETMLDIAQLDNERLLLSKKRIKKSFPIFLQNIDNEEGRKPELWGPLSNLQKKVLKIDESGELIYRFSLESIGKDFSDSKPITCVVPHTCIYNKSCKMTINGITELMRCANHAQQSRFFNLVFELPAGTNEITIKIEGKPGTLVALKDLQIWQ